MGRDSLAEVKPVALSTIPFSFPRCLDLELPRKKADRIGIGCLTKNLTEPERCWAWGGWDGEAIEAGAGGGLAASILQEHSGGEGSHLGPGVCRDGIQPQVRHRSVRPWAAAAPEAKEGAAAAVWRGCGGGSGQSVGGQRLPVRQTSPAVPGRAPGSTGASPPAGGRGRRPGETPSY